MTQVLVVDDSSAIRQLVRAILEREGYTITEAADGVEALVALRAAEAPMVVVLDYQMPNMDGAEVLSTVSREGGALARHEYLVLSANVATFPEVFIELLRHLSIRILSKSEDHATLVSAVAQAAERLAAPAEAPEPWTEDAGQSEESRAESREE
ncbi:MAG: response regulator [Ktedonobacterales bacterium]|nr:response regulator [Ktedonobacterales bacterium]